MSQETTNRSFDDLARGLANGSITRGKALKLMGAALLGGTLASFPGVAWAAKGEEVVRVLAPTSVRASSVVVLRKRRSV